MTTIIAKKELTEETLNVLEAEWKEKLKNAHWFAYDLEDILFHHADTEGWTVKVRHFIAAGNCEELMTAAFDLVFHNSEEVLVLHSIPYAFVEEADQDFAEVLLRLMDHMTKEDNFLEWGEILEAFVTWWLCEYLECDTTNRIR